MIRELRTERDYSGTEKAQELIYLYDESGMIGVMYNSQPYYYHRNLQGDVIAIYDANGEKQVEYAYDAWGNCEVICADTHGLANANPIRYRGYYYDTETGLYYLNARYYSPEWRRFISPDAAEYIDSETPNGLNLYLYCNNDPVNYIDQSGHNRDGFFFQYVISYLMYIGIAVASIFDESIRNDMKAIEWNPFNSDEDLVGKSNKVSFYKGVPIVRAKSPNSSAGSFGVILLPRTGLYGVSGTYWTLEDLIRHEWGHSVQLMTYGPIPYLIYIGIPSVLNNYEDTPWEITASALGGANRKYDEKDLQRGWNYFFFGKFISSLWRW